MCAPSADFTQQQAVHITLLALCHCGIPGLLNRCSPLILQPRESFTRLCCVNARPLQALLTHSHQCANTHPAELHEALPATPEPHPGQHLQILQPQPRTPETCVLCCPVRSLRSTSSSISLSGRPGVTILHQPCWAQ